MGYRPVLPAKVSKTSAKLGDVGGVELMSRPQIAEVGSYCIMQIDSG